MNDATNFAMESLREETPDMLKEDLELRMMLIIFHGALCKEMELYTLDGVYISRFAEGEDGPPVPEGAVSISPKKYYKDLIHPNLMKGLRRKSWAIVDTEKGPTVKHRLLFSDRDYFNVLPYNAAIKFLKSTISEL